MKKTSAQLDREVRELLAPRANNVEVVSSGVLAAAYRGRDIGDRALLRHATSPRDVSIGRLKRSDGEAFCDRKLELAGDWGPKSTVNCSRCLEILARNQL